MIEEKEHPTMRRYNRIRDVIEGLTILMNHGGINLDAQHDIIHAGQSAGQALSEQEIAQMKAAGWHIDSECCDCEIEIDEDNEDQEHKPNCTGWAFFT